MIEPHDLVRNFARDLSSRIEGLRLDTSQGSPSGDFASVVDNLEETREELAVAAEELQAQNEALHEALSNLTEERARFQRLFDLAPDALLLTDRFGSILSANRAAAQLLSVPRDQLHRKPLAPWLSDESVLTFRSTLRRLGRLEEVGEVELEVTGRRGEPVPVSAKAATLPRGGDEEEHLLWSLRDLTDRHQLEETRLRLERERTARVVAEATEDQARFLLRAGAALNGVLDPEVVAGRMASFAVERFGGTCLIEALEEDGLRRLASARLDADGEREVREADPRTRAPAPALDPVLESGCTIFLDGESEAEDVRSVLAAGDGEQTELSEVRSVVAVPLRQGDRIVGALVLASHHESETLAERLLLIQAFCNYGSMALASAVLHHGASARARRAEELGDGRSRAIASLAHEMRTPLNSVIGYADLLLDGIPEPLPEACLPRVRAIRTSARHQADLVEDILSPDGVRGSEPLRSEEVVVGRLVEECVSMVERFASEAGLGLEVGPVADVTLVTDHSRLRQILINLLNNAIKFTPRGTVRTEVVEEGDEVVLSVSDTGLGIPDEELPFIFERFWKGRQEHARPGGSGLGLSVVQALVNRLGGRIEVETRRGEGSRFSVRIPR